MSVDSIGLLAAKDAGFHRSDCRWKPVRFEPMYPPVDQSSADSGFWIPHKPYGICNLSLSPLSAASSALGARRCQFCSYVSPYTHRSTVGCEL